MMMMILWFLILLLVVVIILGGRSSCGCLCGDSEVGCMVVVCWCVLLALLVLCGLTYCR